MRRTRPLALTICAVLAVTGPIDAQDATAPPQAPGATAATDTRAPLFAEMCSECHDGDRIVSKRRTRADWQDVLRKMIEEGALGSEKDFQTVFDYLLTYYGRVYVNDARAEEMAMALGLSRKDADAVVAFRTASGPFADFEALRKVPGIDVKTLDAHKDAVAF